MTGKPDPRVDNHQVRIKPSAAAHIACCVCLNRDNTTRTPATTMVHGYAVCDAHVDLVSQPEFDIFTLHGKEIRPA